MPKFIISAISSRYGPALFPPYLRATAPSRASVIREKRKSHSEKVQEGVYFVTIQAMTHPMIPRVVTQLARLFLSIFILLTHKIIPPVIERARKSDNDPEHYSHSYSCHIFNQYITLIGQEKSYSCETQR